MSRLLQLFRPSRLIDLAVIAVMVWQMHRCLSA